jgi:DNA polymerase-3 subunit beta
MKFETSTEQLYTSAMVAGRFSERRANLPVLSSILIVAESGRLILRATNLECGVEIVVPAKVLEDGVMAIPGSVLTGFLNNARGKTVTVSSEGEVCKVEIERARATIKTIPHEDFPILPKVAADKAFTVKGSDLSRLIRSVAYCASTSAVKPELQSVLLFGEGGKLTAAATDSFRLAEKTVTLKNGTVPQLLIPARNAAELMRVLDAASGDVEVYYNDNQISTHVGNTFYTSRLIDGAFPNYRQILPKTFATEAVLLREDMATSLKTLSIFADKFSQVSLSIDPEQKAIVLSSRNPDVGEQTSTLRATIKGDGIIVSFNGRYLADSLQAISGESIRLEANGPGKPILIKDAADDSFFYLAMPMNR